MKEPGGGLMMNIERGRINAGRHKSTEQAKSRGFYGRGLHATTFEQQQLVRVGVFVGDKGRRYSRQSKMEYEQRAAHPTDR